MKYIIYTKPNCSYCIRAKNLLEIHNLPFEEKIIDVGQLKDPNKNYVTVQELKQKVPTATSVPQIFFGDEYIGGFTEFKNRLS